MSRSKPAADRTGHASTVPTLTRSTMAVAVPDPPTNLGEIGQGLWATLWDLGAGLYMMSDQWTVGRWCSLMERRELFAGEITPLEHGHGQGVAHHQSGGGAGGGGQVQRACLFVYRREKN